jgi:hypothetical protein
MQYPGYASLDPEFRKIKFCCDLAITEAFADQAINRAQHSHFLPEDSHEVNLHMRFFELNRDAIGQRRPAADSRGLLPTFGFARLAQANV